MCAKNSIAFRQTLENKYCNHFIIIFFISYPHFFFHLNPRGYDTQLLLVGKVCF